MQINVYGKGHRKAVQDYVLYVCSTYYYSGQTTGRRTGGGTGEPQILANQLTLFQPEGTLLLPPGFSDLPPALWPSDWASDRRGLFNTANACTCILHCRKFFLGKEP